MPEQAQFLQLLHSRYPLPIAFALLELIIYSSYLEISRVFMSTESIPPSSAIARVIVPSGRAAKQPERLIEVRFAHAGCAEEHAARFHRSREIPHGPVALQRDRSQTHICTQRQALMAGQFRPWERSLASKARHRPLPLVG